MREVNVKFALERSTKGTHVYQEQSNDAGVEKAVGAIYLQKVLFPGAVAPEITVRISISE